MATNPRRSGATLCALLPAASAALWLLLAWDDLASFNEGAAAVT